MNIPCANFIQCSISISGEQNADFDGYFIGEADIDLDGYVCGIFIGSATGAFQGVINADFHGTINGIQVDGMINQSVSGEIDGTVAGSICGTLNGHLRGHLQAVINAHVFGAMVGIYSGLVDGFPVSNPDFPVNNVSSENPDVGIGFPPFDHEGGTLPPGLPDPGDGPGTTTIPPTAIISYPNEPQIYIITCDDLTVYTAEVPEGYFTNLIAAQANADALAFAQHLAEIYCVNHVPATIYQNTPQTCVVTCPSGATASYTAAVGTWSDVTQDLANAGAHEFACLMAQIFCPSAAPPPASPPGFVPPGGGAPPIPPANGLPDNLPPGPSGLFANSEQTATIDCPNGGTFAYTTKTGQFFGSSAAVANAAALSYALDQAMTLRFCIVASENRGQGFLPINAFEIAKDSDYQGAIIALQRTGTNTLFDHPYTFVLDGAPPWQPSAFISPPGVVLLGSAPEWTFQYGSAIERAIAITAGIFDTTFQVDQDRPTYRIRAFRSIPWFVGDIANTSPLPDAEIDNEYDVFLQTEFMTGPFTWGYFAGSDLLPTGLALDTDTGEIYGFATVIQNKTVTFEVAGSAGVKSHKTFTIQTIPACISTAHNLPNATIGTPYSLQLEQVGLVEPPFEWSRISGELPPGLTLHADTGIIDGTPTGSAADYIADIQVIDDSSDTCHKRFFISAVVASCIPTPSPLPEGFVGDAYSKTLQSHNMAPPVVFSIVSGVLPDGLSLDPTGLINGTPTAAQTESFLIKAFDNNGDSCFKQFSITTSNCITNSSPLPAATVGVAYNTTLLAPTLVAPLFWSIASGTLPDGTALNSATGAITGTPTTSEISSFTASVEDDEGTICSKPFQIFTSSTSGWWGDFPFEVTFDIGDPEGTENHDPFETDYTGVTNWAVQIQQPFAGPEWAAGTSISMGGTKHYVGPAVTAHIHVEVLSNPGLNAPIEVRVYSGTRGLLIDTLVQEVGGYDFDIPVDATGGEDYYVTVTCLTDSGLDDADMSYTVTLTAS